MATYTAGDQINRALRLLGVLAEGETPSAATSQDALVAMNQMIDSWNTERLSVFATQDQVFSWPSGEIRRTLGPSGDFVGNRPVLLDDATSAVDPTTEVRILAALRGELGGTTTIVVANRPSTIAMADEVLFLEGGRVVAHGPHDELMRAQPAYSRMVRAYELDRADRAGELA